VPMALAVGPSGLVLGVEPNRYVFKILAKNAALNPMLTRIVPLPFAATREDGDFVFNYSDASFCNGGFLSEIESKNHRHEYTLTVTGKDMEAYLYANYSDDLNRLQLLKIDAEGFDKEILKNLSRLLTDHKPAIMAECYKRLTSAERDELYDVIAGYGYTLYYLENFEADGQRKQINKADMMLHRHFEILAIHSPVL
jgi:FkbM family methyltransferase